MRSFSLLLVLAGGCASPATPPAVPAISVNNQAPTSAMVNDTEVRPPKPGDLERYTEFLGGDGPLIATLNTSMGVIHCRLAAAEAPLTVANFVGLATGQKAWRDPRSEETRVGVPFYDGLVFHRVIPGFMIQGGDPSGDGSGGPGYKFRNEIDDSLRHDRAGVLSMANSGPNTNGSQFFILDGPQLYLDGDYSVFGLCDGADVVEAIAKVPTRSDTPRDPVVILQVTIGRGAAEMATP